MNFETRKKICEIVEIATTTGGVCLSEHHKQQLKSHIRNSPRNVEIAFEVIHHQFKTDHSQVRFLCWDFFVYLFNKSKLAKQLIETNIHELMRLALGFGKGHNLPPPFIQAKQLQKKAIRTLEDWVKQHPNFLRLSTTHLFIKTKIVPTLENRENQPRSVPGEPLREFVGPRLTPAVMEENVKNSKFLQLLEKLQDTYQDLTDEFEQMTNCFKLLFPEFNLQDHTEDVLITEGDEPMNLELAIPSEQIQSVEEDTMNMETFDFEAVNWEEGGEHSSQETEADVIEDVVSIGGLGNADYQINITIGSDVAGQHIHDQELIDNIRSMYKAMSLRYIPFVKESIVTISQASEDQPQRQHWLSELTNFEKRMVEMDEACHTLGLTFTRHRTTDLQNLTKPKKIVENPGLKPTKLVELKRKKSVTEKFVNSKKRKSNEAFVNKNLKTTLPKRKSKVAYHRIDR